MVVSENQFKKAQGIWQESPDRLRSQNRILIGKRTWDEVHAQGCDTAGMILTAAILQVAAIREAQNEKHKVEWVMDGRNKPRCQKGMNSECKHLVQL